METPRDRFIAALERRPIVGRVPHFELVFFLTMEAFGIVHPSQRRYDQWDQMEEGERELHRSQMADMYLRTAERFEHSAIFLHPNPGGFEETVRLIDLIRERSGDRYFLMMHGDATFEIPDGNRMYEFSYRLADEPEAVKAEAAVMVDRALSAAERYAAHGGLDGYALCADYCLNAGPFLSPKLFSEFVTPYLTRLIRGYRELGFYTIKHTDGNIMPILDQAATINMALSRNGCDMDRKLCEIISKNWIFPNPFDKEPFDADVAGKKESFRKAGIEYTINQIDEYRACGINGIHLYALNKYDDVARIAKEAGLLSEV